MCPVLLPLLRGTVKIERDEAANCGAENGRRARLQGISPARQPSWKRLESNDFPSGLLISTA